MSDPTDLSAVESLLQERDALRGWLDRLDQSEASVPEAVRARVRNDYQSRLDGLIDQLRQHADVVAARLREDQAEHDRLRDQAREAREGLAEAELRHAVGEFDAARFESERARFVAELDRHEASIDVVAARIAGLEDVQFAVVREPAIIEPAVSPTTEPGQSFVVEEPPVLEVGIGELMPDDEPPSETDDLLSIFDQAAHAEELETELPVESVDLREPAPSQGAPTSGFGPLSFTPTGGESEPEPPSRPVAPSIVPPLGMPGVDQSPRFVRPASERGSELVELPSERQDRFRVIPDPEPVVPEPSAGEAPEASARTLRCGECGAMNRPLEWYCEKCGAELSAV